MKKYIILPLALLLGILIASCSDNSTNPTPVTETGSIFINSSPTQAAIFVDGTNTNKTTPDSVTGLSTGDHSVKLTLAGYYDTTFTVTVQANLQTTKQITLVTTLNTTTFGPKRIYESADPSASDPSGLDLSTGNTIAISTTDSVNADIYYTSNGYLVQSANLSGHINRKTFFNIASGLNLNDGIDSPIYPTGGTWNTGIADTVTRYVYLYDSDSHYSKIKITDMGGGSGTNPAWVEITWIYNNTATDTRF